MRQGFRCNCSLPIAVHACLFCWCLILPEQLHGEEWHTIRSHRHINATHTSSIPITSKPSTRFEENAPVTSTLFTTQGTTQGTTHGTTRAPLSPNDLFHAACLRHPSESGFNTLLSDPVWSVVTQPLNNSHFIFALIQSKTFNRSNSDFLLANIHPYPYHDVTIPHGVIVSLRPGIDLISPQRPEVASWPLWKLGRAPCDINELYPMFSTSIAIPMNATMDSVSSIAVALPYCTSSFHPNCFVPAAPYIVRAVYAYGNAVGHVPSNNDNISSTDMTGANETNYSEIDMNTDMSSNSTPVAKPVRRMFLLTNGRHFQNFMTPEPQVDVDVFELIDVGSTTIKCALHFNHTRVTPMAALNVGELGNAEYPIVEDDLNFPVIDVKYKLDVMNETHGFTSCYMLVITDLHPFTHYKLVLAIATLDGSYTRRFLTFTTKSDRPTVPLPMMEIPSRSLGPTMFGVRANPILPATGIVHYLEVEVWDTLTDSINVFIYNNSIDLALCQIIGETSQLYSWIISDVHPNTPYKIRARAVLLSDEAVELIRLLGPSAFIDYTLAGIAIIHDSDDRNATAHPNTDETNESTTSHTYTRKRRSFIKNHGKEHVNNGVTDDEQISTPPTHERRYNRQERHQQNFNVPPRPDLASPWTSWILVTTPVALQQPLIIRVTTINRTHAALTWQQQRINGPILSYIVSIFNTSNETITTLTFPGTSTDIFLNYQRLFLDGGRSISAKVVNTVGASDPSNLVDLPDYQPNASIQTSQSDMLIPGYALAVIILAVVFIAVLIIVAVIRCYRKRVFFQFPEPDCWELNRASIVCRREIGRGEFGIVRKGIFEGRVVAVKSLRAGASSEHAKAFIEEAKVMKMLSANGGHPNIVQLIGVMTQEMPLAVVLEYLEHGSLRALLLDTKDHHREFLDLHQLCLFSLDIAEGMCYVTSKNVIHRDLAARNCLVTLDWKVKIADFGFARSPELERHYRATYMKKGDVVLPLRWVAPEILTEGRFCELSDVWSFGVTLWEIFSLGSLPYAEVPPDKLVSHVLSGGRLKQPDDCPRILYILMERCWARERPSFTQIREFLLKALERFQLSPMKNDRVHPELRILNEARHKHDSNEKFSCNKLGDMNVLGDNNLTATNIVTVDDVLAENGSQLHSPLENLPTLNFNSDGLDPVRQQTTILLTWDQQSETPDTPMSVSPPSASHQSFLHSESNHLTEVRYSSTVPSRLLNTEDKVPHMSQKQVCHETQIASTVNKYPTKPIDRSAVNYPKSIREELHGHTSGHSPPKYDIGANLISTSLV